MEALMRYLIVLAVIFLISLYSQRVKARPNRDKRNSARIRVPKIVSVTGWIFIVVGAFMALAVFSAGPTVDMPLGAQITAVAIVAFGGFLLFAYSRWFIEIGSTAITTRKILGGTITTNYRDIVSHTIFSANHQRVLTIKAIDGTKHSINISQYDASPLLSWLAFTQAVGRMPSAAELAFHETTGQWPSDTVTVPVPLEPDHPVARNRNQNPDWEAPAPSPTNASPVPPERTVPPVAPTEPNASTRGYRIEDSRAGSDSYQRPEPFITDLSSLYGKKKKRRD